MYILKGITIINYDVYVEETLDGDQCKTDVNSLETALQFVANQSTKLKIVTESEHHRRAKELNEITSRIQEKVFENGWSPAAMNDAKYLAAKKAASEYGMMPSLSIVIAPMQLPGGCTGSVAARLYASLDRATNSMEIVLTHRYAFNMIEIWSRSYMFKGSQQIFAKQVTGIAEDLMKAFVNDWTASQDLE
jgi:hypothetical protein